MTTPTRMPLLERSLCRSMPAQRPTTMLTRFTQLLHPVRWGRYPVSELSNALRCARTALIAAIRRGLNLRRSPAGGGASGSRHCRCLVAVGRLPPPSQSRYSVPTGGPRQTSRQGSYPPIVPSPLHPSGPGSSRRESTRPARYAVSALGDRRRRLQDADWSRRAGRGGDRSAGSRLHGSTRSGRRFALGIGIGAESSPRWLQLPPESDEPDLTAGLRECPRRDARLCETRNAARQGCRGPALVAKGACRTWAPPRRRISHHR